MRGDGCVALKALVWASAALLLASCSTTPTEEPHAQSQLQAPPPVAPAPVATATPIQPILPDTIPPPAASVSYPRYGDSDDYLCNLAPPGDPRTPQACIRLRGPGAVPQPPAQYGNTDDYVCNHGPPGDPRTIQACNRLRPPPQP
jgi:hypothetical protein